MGNSSGAPSEHDYLSAERHLRPGFRPAERARPRIPGWRVHAATAAALLCLPLLRLALQFRLDAVFTRACASTRARNGAMRPPAQESLFKLVSRR